MKPLVFCLFAVCCWWLAEASGDRTRQRRKLEETLKELGRVKRRLQNSEMMLPTPPENIEECCCLSALGCFGDSFQKKFNTRARLERQFHRSLTNPLTEEGLNFCDSRNSTCKDCSSHPQEKVGEFFSRLEALLQKGIQKQW